LVVFDTSVMGLQPPETFVGYAPLPAPLFFATMKRPFPRQLLWTDVMTVDEFLELPAARGLLNLYKDQQLMHHNHTLEVNVLQVLNEVYYQANRVMFEVEPHLRSVLRDVKASMGERSLADTVLWMTVCLLKVAGDGSEAVQAFIEEGKQRYYVPLFDMLQIAVDGITRSAGNVSGQLKPRPCRPQELDALVIDWNSLTHCFSYEGVEHVLALWDSYVDQLQVVDKIEEAYNLDDMAMMGCVPVSWDYFDKLREELGGEPTYMAAEPFNTIDDLQEENHLLEQRISALESENAMLRSQLNTSKPKKQQERAFTLKLIVDYCKKKPQYSEVKDIVAMLYRFLRHGTDEEQALVDSIDEEFSRRLCAGININSAEVSVNSSGNTIAKNIHYETRE